MENALQDLINLVLTALPTTFLVVLLWIYLKKVLFDPLMKVAADRDAATKGAVEAANSALARAEAKAAEYEAALQTARGEILRTQDAERQKLRQSQSDHIARSREQGAALVESARKELQAETETARQTLLAEADRLSQEIESAVLKGSRN